MQKVNLNILAVVWVLVLLLSVPAAADTHYVSLDESIQTAIDNADNGDEIEVAPGTYYEAINFLGKAVRLYSKDGPEVTTIDASGLGSSVVTCASDEGLNTVLEGFTITGGNAYRGGGMFNDNGSSPTVTDCTFSSNSASVNGGGMLNDGSSPTVTDCTFIGNIAAQSGGGMWNNESSPTVTNGIFSGNIAESYGGGMYNYNSLPTLTNCIFKQNTSQLAKGGGIANYGGSNCTVTNCIFYDNSAANDIGGGIRNYQSSPTVTNCIVWDNEPDQISSESATPVVSYSDIQDGHIGTGNIDSDPLFVDTETENLRLSDFSPCVDAGNNDAVPAGVTADLDGNPRFADDAGMPDTGNGSAPIVDMGAYERQIDSVGPIRNVTQGFYYLQIQAAIDAALEGDEIEVAPGIYEEAINFNGKAVHLYSSDGPGATTIDASGLGSSVVTCISGEDANTILEGFTLTGGTGTTVDTYKYGGGMFNFGSSPTVTDCIFTGNVAGYGGAGMGNENNSNPIVTNCTFNGNTAYGGGAGMGNENNSNPIVTNCTFSDNTALYSGGGMGNVSSSPTVTGCTFSGNTESEFGGGMFNCLSSSPTVTNCAFTNNTSNMFGGGMHNENSSPTVTNCTFSGNTADFGGGMYNMMESNPTVTNCTFSNNWATLEGGGMRNEMFSSPTVTDCIFTGNSADNGGGMHNFDTSPTVTNCTFSSNSAQLDGGGMHNEFPNSIPTVTNCTFRGNTAGDFGGGMYNYESSPNVTNCIFWGNSPDEIYNYDVDSVPIVTYSDVEGGWEGDGNIDADPLFVDMEIENLRLSDCSPCVDAGNNDAVPAGVTTDLDGNPRFADDASMPDTGYGDAPIVDMGAYERQISSVGPICNVTQGLYYLQIQAAIDNANDGDQIEVDAGVYLEAIDFKGKAVRLYSSGGPEVTTIDGDRAYHVVQCVSGEDANTILEGFTITGGNGAFGGGMLNESSSPTVTNCNFSGNSAAEGGGMYNSVSSPTVTNCTFTNNTSMAFGGGMRNWESRPTLTNCTFSGNSADFGGGMLNYNSTPTVTNCNFSGNTANYGPGGGMYNEYSNPTVTSCEFLGNEASWGGGMSNWESSPTVTNCMFSGNHANNTGGGMYNELSSSPTVSDCSFSSNIAAYSGGGMYSKNGSSPIVENCTFSGNQANGDTTYMGGGGMYNWENSPTVTNCTFNSNSAPWEGGGMHNWSSSPTVTNCTFSDNYTPRDGGGMFNKQSSPALTNCTFSGNSANYGGGMYNYDNSNPTITNCTFNNNTANWDGGGILNNGSSSPTVANCILWGNIQGQIVDQDYPTSTTTVTYSDVEGGWGGTGNINTDPLFVDVAVGDLRLGSGSPCIDAGDNTAVPSDVLKDLAGKLRYADDPYTEDTGDDGMTGRPVVDMGAYEFHGCGTIAQNHMVNPGFETGDATGWVTNWGWNLTADANQVYAGNYSGLVSDRTASWQGAWQSLLGLMDDGKTYRISGWVRLKDTASDDVALTVKKVDSTGDHYYSIDNATAYDDKWVKLDGTLNFDADESMTDLYVYFEGPAKDIEFYVDNASVTEVKGDMDHNGGVDFIDFSIFASYYGFDCSTQDCGGANFNDCDNTINELDLLILCNNWLVGTEP